MMKRHQRGIADMWLVAIVVISLIGLVVGGIYGVRAVIAQWDEFTTGLIAQGHQTGVKETEAKYAQRDNAQLEANQKEILALTARARAAEAKAAEAQTANTSLYNQGVRDGKSKSDKVLADLNSGARVLRDPGQRAPACPEPGRDRTAGQVAAAPGGGDGAEGAQLSGQLSEFLVARFTLADEVVRQLQLAQQTLLSDRATCNQD